MSTSNEKTGRMDRIGNWPAKDKADLVNKILFLKGEHGLTNAALAERFGIHVNRIKKMIENDGSK